MVDQTVTVRPCHAIEEFERMVELEVLVWGFGERDVVPSQMYVVAAKIGGQTLGAFVGGKMAGFVLAYPGIRDGRGYLHSHMAAVLPEYRNLGIGRKLKLAQREDALARGISLIEWTFDPLQTRNAYFNICRLGVVVRRYLLDVYGATSSPLHAGLPTDRLVAEWNLDSERVREVLSGREPARGNNLERVHILQDESSTNDIAQIQDMARRRFLDLLAQGYVVTWFEREPGGGAYVLEPMK
ncbi:MAG TPA: GNAT family N-acetyltransferase [Candidatus Eisenbacteria bacterium]|nr:GNAT family N-acetyltransferase [Candidatus Eisenbacteria bacterium]